MVWIPEQQPIVEPPARRLLEWLARSFQKISDWSRTVTPLGHGGLYLTAPVTPPAPITLTQTYQKISAFDAVISDPPVGITQDLANDRIAISEAGMWVWSLMGVGQITPFAANDAITIELSAYNETTGQALLVGYQAVPPRDADAFSISRVALRETPGSLVSVGDYISIWIRQRQAGAPQLVVNVIDDLELSCVRVG